MGANFDKAMERFRETFPKVDQVSRLVIYGGQPNKEEQPTLWWEIEATKELLKALEAFYELDASLKFSDEEFPKVDYDPLERLHTEFAKLYQQSLDIDPELEKWHAALKELQRVYGEFIGIRDMR